MGPGRIHRHQPLHGLGLHGERNQGMAEVVVLIARQAFPFAQHRLFGIPLSRQFQLPLGCFQLFPNRKKSWPNQDEWSVADLLVGPARRG